MTTSTRSVRALEFLGVEPAERRGVALMTAHSFFMGCATVFFETAASATFLSRFSASYIPWVYIAAAGVNTITGTIYSRVQKRFSFARLMNGTLGFLLAIVLGVRLGFAVSSVAWIAFAGLVSYRIISSLTDLEYWAVASRIYDVRQAKRLFGLIGTGEVVARIAGSFSIPLVVKLAGVSNLMVVSAIALGLCILLLQAVLGPFAAAHDSPSKARGSLGASRKARAGIREILGSKYLTLVVGVAILATFGKYFVDFAFLEQIGRVGKDEAHLATILGLFNGLTQTLSLLTRLFVSRPLLQRFGIRVGVIVLPLLHAVCAALTVAVGALGASAAVIFWFVIANQGIYKTVKHPIDNASFKVLYQPLKAEQRLAAQIAVEIIFSPVVVGLAGGVMLLFSAGMHYDPVRFSCVLLANFVAWTWAARAAGRAYAGQLLETLRRRIEPSVALPFDDATTLSVLKKRLESPIAAEVCAVLGLLEKMDVRDLVPTLVKASSHPLAEVRQYALARLLDLQPSALRMLRERIAKDPDASVRCTSVRVIVANAGDSAADEVAEFLADPDLLVRRAAVTALYELNTDKSRALAAAAIDRHATSVVPADRELGARLAGEHRRSDVVIALFADPDGAVKRAAMRGAGKLREPAARTLLVEHLSVPRYAQAAALALAMQGEAAIAELEPHFAPGTDAALLLRIVQVYRLVGGKSGLAGLRRRIAFPDVAVRGAVIGALDALGYVADAGPARESVHTAIHDEAREAALTLAALRDSSATPGLDSLCAALEAELVASRSRALHWLSFIHDRAAVHGVARNIAHPAKEKRAYAHEVLDVLLDGPERADALFLLADGGTAEARLAQRTGELPQPILAPKQRLLSIVARDAQWAGAWTRSLALRAAVARGVTGYDLASWMSSSDAMMRETAEWALGHEQSSPKGTGIMLLIEKVILLKTVQMFAGTSEERLAEIAAVLEAVNVGPGQIIFQKGDAGDSMYVVVTGSVRVFDGAKTLRVLGQREIFGELALLDPEPRSASVEAVEETRLLRLDGDTFAELMAGDLEIVRGVLHVLCARLRRTSAEAGSL